MGIGTTTRSARPARLGRALALAAGSVIALAACGVGLDDPVPPAGAARVGSATASLAMATAAWADRLADAWTRVTTLPSAIPATARLQAREACTATAPGGDGSRFARALLEYLVHPTRTRCAPRAADDAFPGSVLDVRFGETR